ncbi:cysteine desulfurase family protein [Paraglaciecola chathamensis]|uniref:cysteine desulfurase family protein n=1 Tax=Paraglaciecola chathamensis TaxID=368405 RepID=UPI00270B639B|nr:cysteine desulfurase family protein [Paraglaciecola chathamensis]MDO6841234.1 cysteine desulfurase family protein [Paraglaciecola chathamensis]
MIYFDSAASYPLLDEVKVKLTKAFSNLYGNSSATHLAGIQASESIEAVREQLADNIGAYPSEIVFTSGATESNNIALKGALLNNPLFNKKRHIVTASTEHKCILAICAYLETQGFEVSYIRPNNKGIISVEDVKQAVRPDTALVSIMQVNNELGTINPIAEIGEYCFKQEILFHVDAAQSFGKIEIEVDDLNVDLMSFSAHKIGGPKGIGAIYIRDLRNKQLMPVIHGAGHEEGIRGGTVAAPLIVGFGEAISAFPKVYGQLIEAKLKEKFVSLLDEAGIEYRINGAIVDTLPHILSITFPSIDLPLFIRKTEDQFCLAQGSACSSKEIEVSHVLTSLGMNTELGERTLRMSLGHYNENAEIQVLVDALQSI